MANIDQWKPEGIAAPGDETPQPDHSVLPPHPRERAWTSPFPPERPVRSYMMDVDPSDVVELPQRAELVALRDAAQPLAQVPAEAWEPHASRSGPPRVGVVMLYGLHVTEEVNPGGRTPCRQEHSITVHVSSDGPRAPVVLCPIAAWEDLMRYRKSQWTDEALRLAQTGQTWGLLPVLLPRDGFDCEPRVFIDLAAPRAIPYRQADHFGQPIGGSLRMVEPFGTRLAAAFGQVMESSRRR